MRRAPIIIGAVLLIGLGTAVALRASGAAWTDQTTNPSNAVAALTVGLPTGVTGTLAPDCTNITVAWTAGANADDYRVEAWTTAGGWVVLDPSTGPVTSIADTTGYTNTEVKWRVTALLAGTLWETGPSAESASIICGYPPVNDLTATNPCADVLLSFTAPPGTNRYDIQRRVNGGAWTTIVNNQAGTTYTDATNFTPGDTVEYEVRSGQGVANGIWGNTATIASWDTFRIVSWAYVNNGATLGTLEVGDQTVITFSKAVNYSAITDTRTQTTNNGRRHVVPQGTAVGNRIGRTDEVVNWRFSANATLNGTLVWGGGDTVATWTSTSAGMTMVALTQPIVVMTGPKCAADGVTTLESFMLPVPTGRW